MSFFQRKTAPQGPWGPQASVELKGRGLFIIFIWEGKKKQREVEIGFSYIKKIPATFSLIKEIEQLS